MTDLSFIGSGTSHWVCRGSQSIAGPFTSRGNAIAALGGIEARLRPIRFTPCLCCGSGFYSTGKGNRLCQSCKRDA